MLLLVASWHVKEGDHLCQILLCYQIGVTSQQRVIVKYFEGMGFFEKYIPKKCTVKNFTRLYLDRSCIFLFPFSIFAN